MYCEQPRTSIPLLIHIYYNASESLRSYIIHGISFTLSTCLVLIVVQTNPWTNKIPKRSLLTGPICFLTRLTVIYEEKNTLSEQL